MTQTQKIDAFEALNLVYIRPLAEHEVQHLVPEETLQEMEISDRLFAVHNAQGQRIAIVEGREAAFAAAQAHDLKPQSLH